MFFLLALPTRKVYYGICERKEPRHCSYNANFVDPAKQLFIVRAHLHVIHGTAGSVPDVYTTYTLRPIAPGRRRREVQKHGRYKAHVLPSHHWRHDAQA